MDTSWILPSMPAYQTPSDYASVMYDRLVKQVKDFQDSLAETEEVGAAVAHFGMGVTIHVTGIGFANPYLIVFSGLDGDGREVTLMQHVSQVSLLLVPVKPLVEGQPARRIGFNS